MRKIEETHICFDDKIRILELACRIGESQYKETYQKMIELLINDKPVQSKEDR